MLLLYPFYLEALSRLQGNEACTQHTSEWIMSTFQINIDYQPTKCIDFTSAKGKMRQLDEAIQSSQCSQSEAVSEPCKIPKVSSAEEIDVLQQFKQKQYQTRYVILSSRIVQLLCIKTSFLEFPQQLTLHIYFKLSDQELLEMCELVNID